VPAIGDTENCGTSGKGGTRSHCGRQMKKKKKRRNVLHIRGDKVGMTELSKMGLGDGQIKKAG